MSRRLVTNSLPVAASILIGAAVFFLFGGKKITDNSGSYACPMLCVVLEVPGICPVCGMDLEQLVVTGDTIIVSDVGAALAELSSTEISLKNLVTKNRIPAQVVVTSESVVEATSWVEGRITDLRVFGPGEFVEHGDILAVMHSPQVESARTDYQAAILSGDSFLINGATGRLEELGVSIGSETNPSGVAYIRAPVTGIIGDVFKNSGVWLNRGTALLTIVEMNGRELRIDIPSDMILEVDTGMRVSANLSGQLWVGTVNRLAAQLDSGTLTYPVYASIPDSIAAVAGSLVMADVQFSSTEFMVTAVPESAVLILGERSIVYVDLGNAHYVPRVIKIGKLSFDENSEPYYPVIEGLSVGEKVVLGGAFLLDSQAELTGITSLMNVTEENQ